MDLWMGWGTEHPTVLINSSRMPPHSPGVTGNRQELDGTRTWESRHLQDWLSCIIFDEQIQPFEKPPFALNGIEWIQKWEQWTVRMWTERMWICHSKEILYFSFVIHVFTDFFFSSYMYWQKLNQNYFISGVPRDNAPICQSGWRRKTVFPLQGGNSFFIALIFRIP